jgi:membrane-associated phospholipid phosphatase
MEKPSAEAQLAGATTPQEAQQEQRKHRQALFRGRVLFGLGLMLLILFGAVTASIVLLDPLALDVPITREVQELQFGPFGWLLVAVSAPGFEPWNFIFPVAIILGVVLLRRFVEAVFLSFASILAFWSDVIKALVERARPSGDLVQVFQHISGYSFPSGHVTQYTLFFGFCFYLAFTLLKPGWLRTVLLVFCGAMVLLVGPSRIWMGQHWASDTLGGYTLGFGLLLLLIWAYRGWEERLVRHRATRPASETA